ncbi:bifunctional DNA-formamidopyrimidine glycosylase/DNA-(apurinic or apyrimidinic site) lyase [Candidatus Profftia sp. (ex Adelges kitamiensis)]|uniref:bifunctional DNA-formamidopyrimidine glycosylase/DNA-(apurinic or apyrimidinic site) lyase n=1 Tax=Candidatus Profftia sp. (ex Adelges kitamiensis) TaxID=2864218 RepID=UPI001CE2C849|nr:bifunctional DNA-formamidopyrimidine glycosylase/DNA-(apurinic or apyrimidinic site) lyase [Candidatus Profftia sp. (ex Adelges kitamiensis)]
MPELPEVETIRCGIEPYLVGHLIKYFVIRQCKLRWQIPSELIGLHNKLIFSIKRRAKFLLIELDNEWIIIHLGMSGSLRILPVQEKAKKHDHVDMILSNGIMLRYNDPRRFGSWLLCKDLYKRFSHFGPEPLTDKFNGNYLFCKSRNKKNIVKTWLMDNKVVAGVGNIYSNESLFKARINPFKPIGTLTQEDTNILALKIKEVLMLSIDRGGTTLKNFFQSDGKPGYFTQELQVYGRSGQNCVVCEKKILSKKHGNQRTTFFCTYCQQ